MKTIIEAKNISKRYIIHHQKGGYIALRDILANIIKNPFRYMASKVTQVTAREQRETFWALQDINFTIQKGSVVGIIGRNGAGKSTLLKILSQITPPTTGEITLNGRVGSLLEVGTGFHPELTGRENVFLNGAILGMKKKEIESKFDEIVAFAGVEKFLDTPVKYYSSGMYVRLAFSVAAHMEPDILIIDEVLAVGDAEFQKKCLGKMDEITKKEGKTILFVSHNMLAVKQLCKTCILLTKGRVEMIGNTDEVIAAYTNSGNSTTSSIGHYSLTNRTHTPNIRFTDIKVSSTENALILKSHSRLRIALLYTSESSEPIADVRIVITITNNLSKHTVLRLDSDVTKKTLREKIPPQGEIVCETESINLNEGTYNVEVDLLIQGKSVDHIQSAAEFEVHMDLEKYVYTVYPDTSVCEYVIPYSFTDK